MGFLVYSHEHLFNKLKDSSHKYYTNADLYQNFTQPLTRLYLNVLHCSSLQNDNSCVFRRLTSIV